MSKSLSRRANFVPAMINAARHSFERRLFGGNIGQDPFFDEYDAQRARRRANESSVPATGIARRRLVTV